MTKSYAEDNAELLSKAKSGDNIAKDKLVEQNLGLVKSIAKRFSGRGIDSDDLFQIGCIGLISAVNRFDLSYGVKFSTYAVPVIIGEIKRFVRDDGIIKVSRSLKETAAKATYLREKIIKDTGIEPTVTELSKALGIETEYLSSALDSTLCPQSLYQTADNGSDTQKPLVDTLGADKDEMEVALNKMLISQASETLSERERKIIYLRYFKNETQSRISEMLDISQVQVSRLEKKALLKMREVIS